MHDTASIYFLLYLNYRVIMDLLRRQLAVALQHAMEPVGHAPTQSMA